MRTLIGLLLLALPSLASAATVEVTLAKNSAMLARVEKAEQTQAYVAEKGIDVDSSTLPPSALQDISRSLDDLGMLSDYGQGAPEASEMLGELVAKRVVRFTASAAGATGVHFKNCSAIATKVCEFAGSVPAGALKVKDKPACRFVCEHPSGKRFRGKAKCLGE